MIGAGVEVCGISQSKKRKKQTRWWYDEVKKAVNQMKEAYLRNRRQWKRGGV